MRWLGPGSNQKTYLAAMTGAVSARGRLSGFFERPASK